LVASTKDEKGADYCLLSLLKTDVTPKDFKTLSSLAKQIHTPIQIMIMNNKDIAQLDIKQEPTVASFLIDMSTSCRNDETPLPERYVTTGQY